VTEDGSSTAIRVAAALDEPQRRRLYEFVRAARSPVTREDAATALGISRKLAAFHLDKLVDVELLRRRTDPGTSRRVGRRPNAYEVGEATYNFSVPARSHDWLADILVQAVASESAHTSARSAAEQAARDSGAEVGMDARTGLRPGRLGVERALTATVEVLALNGFEPYMAGAQCIRLQNCPFHPLAAKAPELVCGLNHAFVGGVIDGLHADAVEAVLAPAAGECCVEVRRSANDARDV
jgi:predicted ArsR family transcriptional regulator